MDRETRRGKYVQYAHSSSVSSGDVVNINDNNFMGIATKDADADEEIAYLVGGEVKLPQDGTPNPGVGAQAYWSGSGVGTNSSVSSGPLIGVFSENATNGDPAWVLLNVGQTHTTSAA